LTGFEAPAVQQHVVLGGTLIAPEMSVPQRARAAEEFLDSLLPGPTFCACNAVYRSDCIVLSAAGEK
jgi:hypothetical protein